MKRFKFYLPVALFLGLIGNAQAQEQLSQDSTQLLFDDNGAFTQIKVTPEDVATKIVTINPRNDDVLWRKTVLRVVDLRELQNRPLYYPAEDLEEISQKNLFGIIYSHVLDGSLTAYKSQVNLTQTYVPTFTPQNVFNVEEHLDVTNLRYNFEDTWSRVNAMTPGVVKYYIQVVTYIDKSTSVFKSKILAIAPLYDENYNRSLPEVRTGVFFWVPYERLRPFLQEEFIKMNGRNTMPLIDFDNFFIGEYYDSYIIKDYDITSNDIDKNLEDPIEIRKQQDRVEAEILDVEQDLWSY
jgi:gliding motility associated protien GldN